MQYRGHRIEKETAAVGVVDGAGVAQYRWVVYEAALRLAVAESKVAAKEIVDARVEAEPGSHERLRAVGRDGA